MWVVFVKYVYIAGLHVLYITYCANKYTLWLENLTWQFYIKNLFNSVEQFHVSYIVTI